MLKLKKIRAGEYTTLDGKYVIEKEYGFWYGYDAETGTSVVDSESTFREIRESLEGWLNCNK